MQQSKILIINDNQIDAQYIACTLRSRDFEIVLSGNVEEALNYGVQMEPSLIILDSDKVGGVDSCRRIKQFTDIPIIILSENLQKSEELQYLESGADDFIIKPYSIEILCLKAKAVIRRKTHVCCGAMHSNGPQLLPTPG